MGTENQKSRFELALEGLAKKWLITAYERKDKANILRINALNRYLQRENGKARLTQYKNFPIDQFSGKPEISFPNTQENISLDNKQITLEEKQAFTGILDVSAEKSSLWLDNNLRKNGVVFGISQSVDSEILNRLQEWITSNQSEIDEPLFDLSIGMFSQIIDVNIPDDLFLEKPLLIRIGITTSPQFFSQIILINLGNKAHAKIILEVNSSSEADNQNILPVILFGNLGNNSKLDFIETQRTDRSDWYLPFEIVRIGNCATLNRLILDIGGGVTKRNFSVDMIDDEGQARITGIYTPKAAQKMFYDTSQNHHRSNTRSDLLFRGVLEGQSSALWKGNVFVSPGTRGVDGYQLNNHLLIGEDARAESVPGLEILTDDVKCSHGVTLSSIDSDQLFYLQSRGIKTENAVNLIKAGFIEAAVARIEDQTLRKLVMDKFLLLES